MSYTPPNFNLLANIWDCQFPADGDPDWEDVPVQKYIRSRMSLDTSPQVLDGFWRVYAPPIQLRFPRDHDAFLNVPALWNHAVFEVPAGSGQFYRSYWQEVQHQGFPNEYAIILVNPCTAEGLAIGPPLAEMGLGVAADICTPAPEVEEKNYCEFIIDSGTDDLFGVILRYQDPDNYYIARFTGGGGSFELNKVVAGVTTSIDVLGYSSAPSHNTTCDIYFDIEGDALSAQFITEFDDVTLSGTDSTFAGPSSKVGVLLSNVTTATHIDVNISYTLG